MELIMEHIQKKYGKKTAVSDVSLSLSEGIYGLLGPNGAGKSTLMGILTENILPNSGTIRLDGKNIKDLKLEYVKHLGYMPQQQGVYRDFTAEEFLHYMALLKKVPRAEAAKQIPELLNKMNLYSERKNKLGGFSGGMKQRVLIAQAMLGQPKILIFDEPTAGLDPKERIRIRNLISELAFEKIVLIATHVVSDIEFISKEIIIMNRGEIIRKGNCEALLEELNEKVWNVTLTGEQYNAVKGNLVISNIQKSGENKVSAKVIAEEQTLENLQLTEYGISEITLDDLYLYLFRDYSHEEKECV